MTVDQNFVLEAIIGAKTYNLSNSAPFEVIDLDNLGASEATRITERGPAQDGDSDIDFVLEPRTMGLVLQAQSSPTYSYEANRELANKLFKATNTPIILRLTFPSGKVRQIDTQSVGGLKLPLTIASLPAFRFGVVLRAGTPTFYDPNAVSVNFGIAAGSSAFTVPTVIPTFFGGSTLDQTVVITYAGTYREFPVMILYGPIINPIIRNNTTGDKISFQGYTIPQGDYYTIDLRYGRKQVYRNGNPADSRIAETTSDSNLATFALEADPDVPDGLNSIQVTGSGVNGITRLYFQYNNRYDGI